MCHLLAVIVNCGANWNKNCPVDWLAQFCMCLDIALLNKERPTLDAGSTNQQACNLDGLKRERQGNLTFGSFEELRSSSLDVHLQGSCVLSRFPVIILQLCIELQMVYV